MHARRNSWTWRIAVVVALTAGALALTHALWPLVQHTPFIFGFAAAAVSSRVAGKQGGFLAVAIGLVGYLALPPPLPAEGLGSLVVGFVVISGSFSWLLAHRYDIEGALRSSESRLAEAQQLAHIGSWERNELDGTESWSDEVYRIFGVSRTSVTPSFETFSRFAHREDHQIVDRLVKKALADHQPFECEQRIVRPDGETRVVHVRGRVVVDDKGRVTRLIGTAQDITERKAAEEIVRRSEERLQTIIDAEPACVKLVALDGRLLEINRAGLEIVGADALSEVLGHQVVDLVHPDDRGTYVELHNTAVSGLAARGEFRVIGLKGSERWVDSHVVPFETISTGPPERAVLSVTSDVTERKRLEDRLRHAHQMEAVGRLAGGVAHDFNNLLTAITGFTEMVAETLDASDRRRADLAEIQKASVRAAVLTRQLLAYSRRQILQTKVFDLNGLVSDIQKLLHRTIGEDIQLLMTFDPALEPVRADPSQIEQVLLNLAVNARDAMPKGGQLRFITEMVEVDAVAAERRAPMPPGRYVRLTVTDTGTGMPPEVQRHIFEPFFTTKERHKGTGLGLATVYGIVKQSGGYIWVTSEVAGGTSFEIYLPAVHAAVERLVRVEEPATARGGTETVLVAEDDGAVRRLTGVALGHYGYTVIEARDGEEALLLARSNPDREIHLLITDVVMPGLSGRDLAVQLAAERPEMRVLYTSGYAEAVTIRTGLEHGVPVLAKPFLPKELLQRVRDSLDSPLSSVDEERPVDQWISSPDGARSAEHHETPSSALSTLSSNAVD
jgi:two-component system cell cycle sensor histidine kinase/response regulator CckA